MGVTEHDVFAFGLSLPRATEGTVRRRRKLYVGRIVFAALEHEGILGVAFPREWRQAAVDSEPDKFQMPSGGDLRYRWISVRMDAIDVPELQELLLDAWAMCVPKKVMREYVEAMGIAPE